MPKKIIIKIDPKTATVEYAIEGVEGTSCTDITNVLSKGEEVKDQGFTQQYYVPEKLPIFEEN